MPGPGRYVPFDGPQPCRLMIVGEAPGKQEDRQGRGFVGRSGQVLWQFLQRFAGVTRDQCRVGNLYPWRPVEGDEDDAPPSEEQQVEGLEHLKREYAACQPEVVLAVGRTATNALLTACDDAPASAPLEDLHGLVFPARDGSLIIPTFHPAAGLRLPDMLRYTADDCRVLGEVMRGKVEVWQPGKRGYYAPALEGLYRVSPEVAIDTEGAAGTPLSLQYTGVEGLGWVISAQDTERLEEFRRALELSRPTVVLHHAQHDLRVLRTMGIDLIAMGLEVADTMFMAYHDQLVPQNLKGLARRLCGMEMRDYDDVVGPYLTAAKVEWMAGAAAELEQHFGYFDRISPKTGKKLKGHDRLPLKATGMNWLEEADKKITSTLKSLDRADLDNRYSSLPAEARAALPPWPERWGALAHVPEAERLEYAGKDPDATLRVYHRLKASNESKGLGRIHALDHSILPFLDAMEDPEKGGLLVDQERLRALEVELTSEAALKREVLQAFVGDMEFNPGSPDQVAAYLFDTLKLPVKKLTRSKSRGSTDDKTLELLLQEFPEEEFMRLLQDYRETAKFLSTFVSPLWALIRPSGRIVPRTKATRVVSGRFAMEDPNFLAFPARSALGKRIRSIFIAAPGHVLHSADLSQIELRLLAHLSRDPAMLESFRAGKDIHITAASRMFGIPEEKVTKGAMRDGAKTINYGIAYGIEAPGLQMQMALKGVKMTLEECEGFRQKWFDAFPGVKPWMDEVVQRARRDGFASTPMGRRRYLPALRLQGDGWPFEALRNEAERQARNIPMQGGAAEEIKGDMYRAWTGVYPVLHELGYYARPLLQIHDEILSEVSAEEEAMGVFDTLMLDAMKSEEYLVPVMAESRFAKDWGGLK